MEIAASDRTTGVAAMTAAIFRDGTDAPRLEPIDPPALRDDEALVRIVACGICHTDLTCRDGFMALPRPVVLGHEGSGIVERIGPGITDIVAGDAVVLTFQSCGRCALCAGGRSAYCLEFLPRNLTGRRPDGSSALTCCGESVAGHFFGQSSFATHSVVGRRNMVKVRGDAPLELLGPLGCGAQTGAGSVFNVLRPNAGESILILGAGGVGLSAVMAAAVAGCDPIIVVEPHADRRALALEVGATHTIDPAKVGGLAERIQAIAGPVAHALDTSGHAGTIAEAAVALGMRGQLALVTGSSLEATVALPLLGLVGRGITIRGVNMGDSEPEDFIPKLVDLVLAGRFPLDRIVRFYPFADIATALADQASGRVVKPILRMT